MVLRNPDEIIEIRNGVIRHYTESTIAEAPIESVIGQIIQRVPTSVPVLPRNPTRMLHFNAESRRGAILIETPPMLRDIKVYHHSNSGYSPDGERRAEDGTGIWRVQFPYTYFLFSFGYNPDEPNAGATRHLGVHGSYLYFSRQPVRTGEELLSFAACPNVDNGGGICWGNNAVTNETLNGRFDAMIQSFWDSQFNEDLGHHTPFGTSLTDWEVASTDPLAWLTWNWWDHEAQSRTAKDLMSQMTSDEFNAEEYMLSNLEPDHVSLPELPTNFTVGRAVEWLESLSDPARARLLVAANTLAAAEEVTA